MAGAGGTPAGGTSAPPVAKRSESELLNVVRRVREHLGKEPAVVRFDSNRLLVAGDIHGDTPATKEILKRFVVGKYDHLLLLGDYVDRGPAQVETLSLLLNLQAALPDRVHMLRGNHETYSMHSRLGFLEEVVASYSKDLYKEYTSLFSNLPYAAVVNGTVFACHGGLPRGLERLDVIEKLPGRVPDPQSEILLQLLWNDPREGIKGFLHNEMRDYLYFFGKDVFDRFMEENRLTLFLRSHEVFPQGHKFLFDRKLLSLYTSPRFPSSIEGKMVELVDGKPGLVPVG